MNGPPPAPVTTMASPFRMDYTYVAGSGRSVFLRGLADRRMLARRCPGCAQVYLPPPECCSRCLLALEAAFEVDGAGSVSTFCVVNFPFPGQIYEPPYVVAHIQLHGTDTRLMHLIREVAPSQVHIGMKVSPVWADEPAPSLASILYYRPQGTSDA